MKVIATIYIANVQWTLFSSPKSKQKTNIA